MSNRHVINGHVIITQYVFPPVPFRSMDWNAVTDNYDGPGSPMGHGATEQAAIDDLVEILIDKDIEAAARAARAKPAPRSAFNLPYVPEPAPTRCTAWDHHFTKE